VAVAAAAAAAAENFASSSCLRWLKVMACVTSAEVLSRVSRP